MTPKLYIDLSKIRYAPGETISGNILWALEEPPPELRLTLGWWTEGRGTKDFKIEDSREWESVAAAGEEAFTLHLRASPYSFSGTLITLKWAIELNAPSQKATAVEAIVVAPGDTPIDLPHLDESRKKSFSLFRNR